MSRALRTARLDAVEHALVLGRGDHGDGKTLGPETTGTADAVKVRVGAVGGIVILCDDESDAISSYLPVSRTMTTFWAASQA